MPPNRRGTMYYPTAATKAVRHGAAVTEDGVVGVAVKQKEPGITRHYEDRDLIDVGEKFAIISKGVVTVDTVAGFAKGDKVYIQPADNVLTETATSNLKYGVVIEVAGERGCPTGKVRIDLDKKDSF